MNLALDIIRRAESNQPDSTLAAAELSEQLHMENAALTLFFCAKQYSNPCFAKALSDAGENSTVIGCTTSGEIGKCGYQKDSVVAVSFPKDQFSASYQVIEDLKNFTVDDADAYVEALKNDVGCTDDNSSQVFAMLLIDGLSLVEEPITFKLQDAFGEIPLVGGSAGDELTFASTEVYAGGEFKSDRAVVVLIRTSRPWEAFKEHHFHPTTTKAVVTAADPEKRLIEELNGEPAAIELARLLELSGPEALDPVILTKNPLMLRLGGSWFLRSIQGANSDHTLTSFCAVDVGMVLSIGESSDMGASLSKKLDNISSRLGHIQFTLAYDCVQRRIELIANDQLDSVSSILSKHNALGFSTYGEQFGSVHINQTLTGIIIG